MGFRGDTTIDNPLIILGSWSNQHTVYWKGHVKSDWKPYKQGLARILIATPQKETEQ